MRWLALTVSREVGPRLEELKRALGMAIRLEYTVQIHLTEQLFGNPHSVDTDQGFTGVSVRQ